MKFAFSQLNFIIEFLEYLDPKPGRAFPADAKAHDLLHWQTTLVMRDLAEIFKRLRLNRSIFISDNIVSLLMQKLGFDRGISVRDPDGYVIRLVEK